MLMLLDVLNKHWNKLGVVASAIAAALAGFLALPPVGLTDAAWSKFDVFLITLIVGLWLVLTNRWKLRRHVRYWWFAALLMVSLCIGSVLTYSAILDEWTIPYWRDQRVVIGSTRKPFAVEQAKLLEEKHLPADNASLLQKFSGRVTDVWNEDEIAERGRQLEVIYVGTVFLLASALITVLQAVYCSLRRPSVSSPLEKSLL